MLHSVPREYLFFFLYVSIKDVDQPRGLVVRGPGFDSRLYHVRFSLKGEDAHGDHGLGSW